MADDHLSGADRGITSEVLLIAAASLALCLGSCGGGGGGGGAVTPNETGTHGAILPETPAGIGIAGDMEGRWRVVQADLQPMPEQEGDLSEPLCFSIGDELSIVSGELQFDEEDVGPNDPSVPTTIDLFANGSNGTLLQYCLGVTLGSSGVLLGGNIQIGMVAGTVSATDAVAMTLCRQRIDSQIPGSAPVSKRDFSQWLLRLQRVP